MLKKKKRTEKTDEQKSDQMFRGGAELVVGQLGISIAVCRRDKRKRKKKGDKGRDSRDFVEPAGMSRSSKRL